MRYLSFISLLAVAALLVGVAGVAEANHAPGTTVRVDDSDTMSDVGGCGSNANPCNTIQAGVDHATAGQTVRVAAGTYNEQVFVNKTLTLRGAQFNDDATNRNVPLAQESVVNGSFNLQANTIVLNGFLVRNNATGAGVTTGSGFSGYRITHNIIRNNVFGLYLNSANGTNVLVSRNLFDMNNQAGSASGNAIYSDQGLYNARIERNRSVEHDNSAFTLTKVPVPPTNSNIIYERNESVRDVNMVNLYHSSNVLISRNTARGINDPNFDGGAIYLAGGNSDVTISRNDIHDRSWTGIIVDNIISAANSDVRIERNTLRQLGNDGIDVRSGSVGAGEALIERNDVRQVTKDGILLGATTSGNTISRNFIRNGGEHDAHDNSTGGGTAGTANTWTDNNCNVDQPNGLCD